MQAVLTEEHEMIRDSAREFAERTLRPHAARLDREEAFPAAALQEAGEMGFLGLNTPEEYGGAGLGNLHTAVMLEELNRCDASVGVTVSVHLSLLCTPLIKFGTPEQKAKYLPRLATGEILGAYCLTEPASGSDAASMRTRAVKRDGGWVLRGTKAWVTTGADAGLYIVYALSDPEGERGRNISAFLVERETPGFVVGKREKKLGIRASSTTEIQLEDAFVPQENLLGKEGSGFKIALDTLDGGRIGIAAQAVGIHRACLEESIRYAKERQQFGRPIGDFQAIAWKLADMATSLEAARALVHAAAARRDSGERCTKEAAMAKLFASKACNRAAQEAVQIHGGAGYTTEFPVERFYRDARITEIYEGATDIQRLVISRYLLK